MYKTVLGLEIHIELNTKTKMFCSCLNDQDEHRPNANICEICTGQPGSLPAINKEAVRKVLKTGLALNCRVPEYSKFDRKNYFYPDLPKGYQISQLYQPLCKQGFLEISGKKIRIREVHLEEDTGRLVHPVRNKPPQAAAAVPLAGRISNGVHEKSCSLVDFNRAGIPLMELVTEPDLDSAKETRKFAEELHLIMHYLNVSDADMEKGQMRIEANVSLQRKSEIRNPKSEINSKSKIQNPKLGAKVEIKNLNSFRAVERAVDYEIERQAKVLESGKKVIQETRGWDENRGVTVSQREKEEAHDYRYFPEPDLPPLHITPEMLNEIKAEIPELPQQRRARLKREYELAEEPVEILVYNKDLGEYFEKTVSELPPNLSKENLLKMTKLTSNYIITDLQGLLKGASVAGEDFLITAENFAEFINLIYEGEISSKIAKMVLEEMFKTGADPSHIIEEKGLTQITDEAEIKKIIEEVVFQNQKAIEDYKKGKEGVLQFLIGQAMAKSKGKANPEVLNKILGQILTKEK